MVERGLAVAHFAQQLKPLSLLLVLGVLAKCIDAVVLGLRPASV